MGLLSQHHDFLPGFSPGNGRMGDYVFNQEGITMSMMDKFSA